MEEAVEDVPYRNVTSGLVAVMAKEIQTSPEAASGSAFPPSAFSTQHQARPKSVSGANARCPHSELESSQAS